MQLFTKKSQTAMEFLMNYGWALFIVLIVIASLVYFGVLDSDNYLPDKVDLSQGISIESASIDENSVTFVLRNDLGKDIYDFQFNASGCNDGAGGLSDPINLTAGKLKKVTFYCEHDYDQGDKLDSDLSATWKTKTSTKGSSYDFDHVARGSIKVAVGLGKTLMDQVSVSAPGILDGSNKVYTLTDNITDNSLTSNMFTINGSNVIFDCDGYIISSDDSYVGIYSTGQDNLTIRNCNIDMGASGGGYGIHLAGVTNSVITNNTVNNQYFGIYITGISSNITINGNIAQSNSATGIYFKEGHYSNLNNNTANSNGDRGLELYNSSYNIIENNTFKNNQDNGGLELRYSTYNNFTNNNITGNNNYGIWLWQYSSYNNFVNINATATSGYKRAVYFRDYSGSNNFTNSSFSDPTQSYDPMLMSTATNNNFVNCSYTLVNEYVCSGCDMERKWYYQLYVNDTLGAPVEGANVSAYDKNDVLRHTWTTDSNGLIPMDELTEYRRVSSTRTYYYPYTINVTKDDKIGEHASYTLNDNNLNDVITIAVCGDSQVDGTEECDLGGSNTDTPCTPGAYGTNCTYCDTTCHNLSVTGSYCGDSTCDAGHETINNCSVDCGYPLSSCSYISGTGRKYVLTVDIEDNTLVTDCIRVGSSQMTVDCDGHSIKTNKTVAGIYSGASYTTIKNCNINTSGEGIELYKSSRATVYDNNITGSSKGILVRTANSQYHVIENNTITYSGYGIYQRDTDYNYYDTYNTYRNNTIIYNSYGFYNYRSEYDTVTRNNISNNSVRGMYSESQSYHFTITDNIITYNGGDGMFFDLISYYTIRNNTVTNNRGSGFYTWMFRSSTVENNTFSSNYNYGIYYSGTSTQFDNNIACGNERYDDFYGNTDSWTTPSSCTGSSGNTFTNVTVCKGTPSDPTYSACP